MPQTILAAAAVQDSLTVEVGFHVAEDPDSAAASASNSQRTRGVLAPWVTRQAATWVGGDTLRHQDPPRR